MNRILVVDNEAELRELYRLAVQGDDREVAEASDEATAVELLRSQRFDVIVVDLRMERKDSGLAVLKAAKEVERSTQVIVVTVYGTPEVSVEVMNLGAFDYLQRNSPALDFFPVLRHKINLALRFRAALVKSACP